jgi:hypothetical protein
MLSRWLPPEIVAYVCAAVAVVAAFGAVVAAQNGLPKPSALIQMATTDPEAELARATDPGFVLVPSQAHYDGVYYYAMARDPLLLGEDHKLIDQAAYRYGHPFYGWLATILTLGNHRAVPAALMFLSLAGIGTAAWAASRLSVLFGLTPWGGLIVAASPGLLYAATVSTTECVGAALLGLSLLTWLRGRIVLAGLVMGAACLTKEPFVFVPAGLGLWDLLQVRRTHAWPPDLRLRVAALAAGPVALACWFLYVHARLDTWPMGYQEDNIGVPFAGWIDMFRLERILAGGSFDQTQIGVTSPPLMLAVGLILVVASVKALQLQTPMDGIVLAWTAIVACWGWRVMTYPHDIVREPAMPLLLAVGSLFIGPYRPQQPAAVQPAPVLLATPPAPE